MDGSCIGIDRFHLALVSLKGEAQPFGLLMRYENAKIALVNHSSRAINSFLAVRKELFSLAFTYLPNPLT